MNLLIRFGCLYGLSKNKILTPKYRPLYIMTNIGNRNKIKILQIYRIFFEIYFSIV